MGKLDRSRRYPVPNSPAPNSPAPNSNVGKNVMYAVKMRFLVIFPTLELGAGEFGTGYLRDLSNFPMLV